LSESIHVYVQIMCLLSISLAKPVSHLYLLSRKTSVLSSLVVFSFFNQIEIEAVNVGGRVVYVSLLNLSLATFAFTSLYIQKGFSNII